MLPQSCTSYEKPPHGKGTPYSLTVMDKQQDLARHVRLNTLFKYMYRDASNYKLHGEAIFTNRTLLPLEEIEKQIRSFLSDSEYFIAGQVNIEERFFDVLHEDDHPWHEFESVEETSTKAFDPENWKQRQHLRDIREFIADLEKAHRSWLG